MDEPKSGKLNSGKITDQVNHCNSSQSTTNSIELIDANLVNWYPNRLYSIIAKKLISSLIEIASLRGVMGNHVPHFCVNKNNCAAVRPYPGLPMIIITVYVLCDRPIDESSINYGNYYIFLE